MRHLKIYLAITNRDVNEGHFEAFYRNMQNAFGSDVTFNFHRPNRNYDPSILDECDLCIAFVPDNGIIGYGVTEQISLKPTIIYHKKGLYYDYSTERVKPYSGDKADYTLVKISNYSGFTNLNINWNNLSESSVCRANINSKIEQLFGNKFPSMSAAPVAKRYAQVAKRTDNYMFTDSLTLNDLLLIC